MSKAPKKAPKTPVSDLPETEISTSASRNPLIHAQGDERDRASATDDLPDIDLDDLLGEEADEATDQAIALPAHVAGSGNLDKLVDKARSYAEAATAENTNKAYRADWKHFASWCRRKGVDALVPSPAIIGLYITDCAKPQDGSPALSVSTIERRLSGISSNYRQRGLYLDLKDRHIASVWAGIKRQHAKPPVQKEPVTPEELLEMVATLTFGLRDLRDRAILLIGYAGGMRRSEIVGLDVNRDETEDGRGWVEIEKEGAIVILSTKTGWKDKEIARGSSEQSCPVHALEQWLHFAKIAHGPIFRRVLRDNSGVQSDRLSDKHVARLIKRTMLSAGIRSELTDKERLALFSGHSLRSGLASYAEVDERYVQKHLGHASAEQTRAYQRRRDRFRVNLTKAAGL
ncbi:tyrosine-type recombinase/integrase [Litoreibacter roseus]|uniref:Integrase n=1 Tax=Litoreibacter roseus TaxID=2601869 RepID=A0A6N6JLY4_9RHOB|nr:tyrosine-type recombinase/integrase [Litoreibacter roseus]GFE66977.1 integrase [Litoreibacter roseus]